MLNYIIKIIDGDRKEDKLLLKEFLEDLPSNGCIEYIGSLMGKSWYKDDLFSKLNTVCHKWDNVEHEFFDKKIEKSKKDFFKKAKDYISYISLNTFTKEYNVDMCGVAEEWRENNLQKYEEACIKIPEKGELVGKSYDEFVRLAKKNLNKPKISWVIYAIIILLLPIIGSVMTILFQKYL